jgi:hypothetical protein
LTRSCKLSLRVAQNLPLSAVDKEIAVTDGKLKDFREQPATMKHFSGLEAFKTEVKSKVRERGQQLAAVRKRMRGEQKLPEEKEISFEENEEDEEDDEEGLQLRDEDREPLDKKYQWGWKKIPTGSLIGTLLKFDFNERSSKHAVHVQTECNRFLASCRNYLSARFPKDPVLTALMAMFEPVEWKQDAVERMKQLTESAAIVVQQFGSYIDEERLKLLELASFHTRMEHWLKTNISNQVVEISRGKQETKKVLPSMNQVCTAFLTDAQAVA